MRRWRLPLILAAAAAPVAALLAWAAPAQAFVCPDRTICFFEHTDYTGTVSQFSATNPDNRNNWKVIPPSTRGSVNNNTGSDVGVWNALNNVGICLPPQTRISLASHYGWFYLHYGVTGCQGIPPGP